MLKDFRDFINRGNFLDLAVGVIIGGAFGKIVDAVVNNLLNPIIGLILSFTGQGNLDKTFVAIKEGKTPGPYATIEEATKAGAVVLGYGAFIAAVINFVAVGFVLFLIVKAANKAKKTEPAAPAPAPEPPAQEVLLAEIRDLLKQKA